MSIDMSSASPAEDRISRLPCDILEKILGCLPLRDAIRTSVLSKQWSYKWVVRSELAFDKANVHRGLLKTIIYQYLRHLKLCRCKFYPPPNYRAFSTLATLNFWFVTFEPTSFQTLLSNSPLLERVTLICCTPFDSLIVDAPSLKFFEFSGRANSIFFMKTPLLKQIVLDLLFKKSFAVPESQVTLHNIKILKFKRLILDKVEWVAYALYLINRCPNLERLQITSFGLDDPVLHILRSQEMPHSPLTQLKSVDMILMQDNKAEMEFLKYVLSSASALEKVCVVTRERLSHRRMAMMEEMKQFPRASPNVECLYKVDFPFKN
ncbi:F-box/FBD/LRR-repeat protein At1g13570-like [Lycium ferocissimum]|uniref:F-box/FBD/LRR-repeat protein At1g13570-like n=1 Tax=Lycium ferocissimum TaxID=112874 RepID=UPI00281544D4|nr:F-box/FBD/LRR-repeat protein At1g13570-like [Lycium ferocissimum]